MAYKELIKNFSKIRNYLKEFFIYGYKPRGNVGRKSDRSYDDEKRRIQSWLGDFVTENKGADGKTTGINIDIRNIGFNPLYRAWKSASFTNKDITFHFILMDLLNDKDKLSISEIISIIEEEYLSNFNRPLEFDESTIRKKLAEYEKYGLVETTKAGNKLVYSLPKQALRAAIEPAEGIATNEVGAQGETSPSPIQNALDFSSEILPAGIIGSTLLDRMDKHENSFSFKHHYITQTMDSEILLTLFSAIRKKHYALILSYNEHKNAIKNTKGSFSKIIPLKILSSSQMGRQYLLAYVLKQKKLKTFRLDNILDVKILDACKNHDDVMKQYEKADKYRWGVSFGNSTELETIDFTVTFSDDEKHIFQRLVREKRCGTVERLSENEARYFAQVWDVHEMLPWIRTFIMRITDLHSSNAEFEKQFWEDVRQMKKNYEDAPYDL